MTSGTAGYRNAWRSCNTTKDLPPDPKLMLLDELKMQDREETEQIDVIGGRAIDQRFGISDQYFVLDTIEKDSVLSNPSEGYFVFNMRSLGITGQEYVGVKDHLTNVIALEVGGFLYPQLCCPTIECKDPCTKPNTEDTPLPTYDCYDPLPYNMMSMQIAEVVLQAISDPCDIFHSFEFNRVTGNAGKVYMMPQNPVYIFTDPILNLDSFSLTFRNPDKRVCFKEDVLRDVKLDICILLTLDEFGNELSNYTLCFKYDNNLLLPGDKLIIQCDRIRGNINNDIANFLKGTNGKNSETKYYLVVSSATQNEFSISQDFFKTPENTLNYILANSTNDTGALNKVQVQSNPTYSDINIDSTQYFFPLDIAGLPSPVISNPIKGKKFTFISQNPNNNTIISSVNSIMFDIKVPSSDPLIGERTIFHLKDKKDIYDNGVVLTVGPPLTYMNIIVLNRRFRIPMRARKIVRRVTNFMAP